MIVPDNETAVDLLYYESIARTVTRLVNEKSDEPLTVGVHGDWGAGKSSVLMMVEEAFAKIDCVLCVRFNGWLFQGYEDAKAVLIETIVEELRQRRSASTKIIDQANKVLRRVDWMKVARKAGGLAFSVATGIPHPDTLKDLYEAASGLIGKSTESITAADLKSVAEQAGQYLKEAELETAPEQMHAFREEFEELLRRADIDRLVVLVDDLDRCLPKTAIETLEAIRLFLFVPKAAFVIAADEGMIEYAVRQHFPDLPVASGPATYARNYLEKLIQVPFRLPSLGYAETRIYITLLLVLNECGEASDEFQKLIPFARQVLQRPWKGPGLDRKGVAEALGSVPDSVERALDLAYRIAPILTDGARGNPRQVKRFINTMSLRLAIAEERGFGDDLNPTVLAKIMLAERFAPEVYDAIARGSAGTGASEELAALEAVVRGDGTEAGKPRDGRKADKPAEVDAGAPTLPDWPNLEWAKQWAKIDPLLAEYDLRPYVFVTRDRRSVFGAVTSLGELDELLSKLSGPPLQVRQAAASVARLPATEAEQLFDALRAKVSMVEDLSEQPPGAQGLAVICQHHEFLQASLIALLKGLPVPKLGPWVVGGWARALTTEAAKRDYRTLLSEWAAQDKNKPLQAAAKAVVQMGKRGGEALMGTSGTFGGAKSGLVPSWVDDPPSAPVAAPGDGAPVFGDGGSDGDGGAENPAPPAAYPPLQPPPSSSGLGTARGNITLGARTSANGAIRRGAGQYVAASGGGRGAARRMSSSRAAAGGIAGLARSFVTQGPTGALRLFNLEGLAGGPAVDVFVALTDALCPPGGTIDEAIARDAMLETVAALAAEGVGNFDDLTAEDLQEFFIGVVSRSIEGKIMNEVGTNSIRVSPDLAAVERVQRMLHDFVDGCVRDRFAARGSSLTDITSQQIDYFVSDLYAAAFDLMQTLGEVA